MFEKYEIALPDLDKVDPDKDGLPGLSATKFAQERVNELAKKITELPMGSPAWYDVLYLLLLEYGTNLKYLNPMLAKIPGAIIISTGLIMAIKYWANRIGVKVKDLKNPESF